MQASFSDDISETVARALMEDLGSGDISASLIAADASARAEVVCREEAVLCGAAWFDEVFRQVDAGVEVTWQARDGDKVQTGQLLCVLQGKARALLSGERCALNFLQTLSGTATKVQHYVHCIKDTGAVLLDTRKTLPGLRKAQKYAVLCGGGQNHRMGLYDAFLIKENHILAAGSITQAVHAAKAAAPLPVEVEVENLNELREAMQAGAERALLDNFSIDLLRKAVAVAKGKIELEASGGITLENLRETAVTGVDYISLGTLTKDLRAVDLSMRFVKET